MPRGETQVTKVKRLINAAAPAAAAVEIAKKKILDKEAKKFGLLDSIRKHLSRAIDRMDPLETAAVFGATYVIKQGIDWTEQATAKVLVNATSLLWLIDPLHLYFKEAPPPTPEQKHSQEDAIKAFLNKPDAEAIEWVVSFTAAFIIVRHFDAIVDFFKSVGSNLDLVGMATLLLKL